MNLVYCSRLENGHNPSFEYKLEGRAIQQYPENGSRITFSINEIQELYVERIMECKIIPQDLIKHLKNSLDFDYLKWILSVSADCGSKCYLKGKELSFVKDYITPITMETSEIIIWAGALDIYAVDCFLEKKEDYYVLVRPPGHHAGKSFAGGFCYLNNVGIAVEYLISSEKKYNRIAILDLDLHFGNGTVEFVKEKEKVKYYSLHYGTLNCYPFTDSKEYTHFKNIELKELGYATNSITYLKALEKVLQKIALEMPQVLFISMGYDTYKQDPSAAFLLEKDSFREIADLIKRYIKVPIIAFHEGGYCGEDTKECWKAFLAGMKGKRKYDCI